jgi:hypothetical protein
MIKSLTIIFLFLTNISFSNIIYIGTSGSDQSGEGSLDNPFLTIQHGINESTTGDTVLILEGYYSENIVYDMSMNFDDYIALTLCSEFTITGDSSKISSTVISGQESGSILKFKRVGSIIIDGITIEGGYNEYQSQDGLWVESTEKFTFSNSILKNCQVYNGEGVGGRLSSLDSVFIYNSKIISNHDNFNTDGVIKINNVDYASIKKVEFFDNSSVTGSSIRLEDTFYLEIDSSRFENNISNEGGIIWTGQSTISIKNSIFKDNSGLLSVLGYGDPGVFLIDINQTSIIDNNDVIKYHNYSSPPQNGSQVPELQISNTLFWGDNTIANLFYVNNDFYDQFVGSINISNSLIDTSSINFWNDIISGTNNIFTNPLFCDEENADYTLAANSPLVSGGANGTQIGCFGVGCNAVYNGPNWYVSNGGSNDDGDGSEQNPFNTIQFGLDRMLNGDTLKIYEGDYYEESFGTNKDVVIMSYPSNEVTVYGQLYLESYSSHVEGLNFKGSPGNYFPAMHLTARSLDPSLEPLITIKNCNIYSYYDGIVFSSQGNLSDEGNFLLENVAVVNNSNGLLLIGYNQTSFLVTANNVTFSGNVNYNIGFYSGGELPPPRAEINNSILWSTDNDSIQSGIYIEDTEIIPDSIATITHSNIYGGWNGEGNIDLNPQFCDPSEENLTLAETSPCVGTGLGGSNMGAFGVGCLLPDMALINDNFEVYESVGLLNVLNNDIVTFEIIDSLEIIYDSDEINFTTNENLEIEYEITDGFYGSENFTYVVHYYGESDSAEVTVEVFLETQLISTVTEGQIYGGFAMLDETSLYAVSSNDAVYRYNDELLQYYNLQVGGEINSASTITNDHKVYIASSDNNLYSFNLAGVSNPNWPRPMGSELTASVTLDLDGNLYLGTNNGIFQAVTENNESIWSYNCGSPIYSSAVITLNNRLIICTYDGRIICFNLNTINYETPSFDWLLPTGSQIKSSPAVDDMGFIYVTTMDGKLLKINDEGFSSEIVWQINTQQTIEASPILDGNGNIIIASVEGVINKISPEGENVWTNINENHQIIGTPAFDNNNNLFTALIFEETDSTETDSGLIMRTNTFTSLRGYDADGIIFTKTNVPGAIESSLLINQGDIYFGNTDGVVFKKSYPISSITRNELPMWGTFQGNNQRTGNQSANQLNHISESLVPSNYLLYQNYPNPFNPTTQIRYDLPQDALVSISIYDVMGRMIKSLSNANQTAGYHSLKWDATNDFGEGVSAGMYIYTIQAGEYRSTKKMVLLK